MNTKSTATEKLGTRVIIVGNTGAGKTTLANALAARLGVDHVELDALHWEPNWTPTERDAFRAKARAALSPSGWVADGNYRKVRDIVWSRAHTLVWLDYPLAVILWRLARRSLRRVTRQEKLWGHSQETWRGLFFSRDSLFLWALQKQWSRRREYRQLVADPAYTHLAIYRFRHPRETARWLATLNKME